VAKEEYFNTEGLIRIILNSELAVMPVLLELQASELPSAFDP
jgi:hypothetical protein